MENPSFHLEGVIKDHDSMQDFEGPLSLILMLLQKNKIEIRDLRISEILDQYLEYLQRMESLDLEIASEFVQMASHLLYLKTRELLTTEEEVSELELLMQSLEQLQAKDRFAAMAVVLPQLKKASETGLLYMTKLPEPLKLPKQEYSYKHEPVELLKAILNLWTRDGATSPATEEHLFAAVPKRITYSVRDKGRELITGLKNGPKALSLLYMQCRSGSELVATFVAVLELCRSGNVQFHKVEDQIILQLSDSGTEIEKVLEAFEEET